VYDQLIDVVNNEAEHSRNLTSSVEQDPVTRFEKIVQNVNTAVSEFVKQETAPINWTRVNIFLLELSNGHLCLAGIGRLMNMFLQAQEDATFKTYDLFGSLDQPADINPDKIFSNIICGDFKAGDLLIAGSKNFERYRNELRIKERLTTLPPVTAALEIKQDLELRSVPDDFIATVVACMPMDEPKPMQQPLAFEKEKSTASIEGLRRTEADALRYLAPTFGKKDEPDRTMAEPTAPKLGGRFNPIAFIRSLLKRERTRDIANMVNLRGMHAGFGTLFTKKKKNILIVGVAVVLVAILLGAYIKHRQNVSAQETAWNAAYDQAKAAVGRAEGEAVYSEDRARETLASALSAANNLDAGTASRKDAIAKLIAQTSDLKKKLQRIQDVGSPAQLFALPDGIADGALSSPILFQNKIIFLDRADKQLVAVDPTTKEAKKIDLPPNTAAPVAIGAGKSSVIIALEDKTLLAATIDDGKVAKATIGSSGIQAVTDAVTYTGSRLYVLDAPSQQIWKFTSASGAFGNGAKYLQATNSNLTNAVSLAIDSNVYVLSSDGKIARFMSGGQDGFALTTIDPPLTSANQIWTDPDSNVVAITDQNGKRVLVFTKDGKLMGQYTSSAFKGPVDLTGDPKTKNLYVADSSNKIFVLPLP
jgi:sugar lactone lactonase YvrE/uncharacterized protein (UPF0333 family)